MRTRLGVLVLALAAILAWSLPANAQGDGGPPMMRAPGWVTVENAGQTWDGVWTFTDGGHRTMSGSWVNRQTGQRAYARNMTVRQEGRQLVISRPGLGNYVGTLSSDGRSISGTMSWVSGRFTARM